MLTDPLQSSAPVSSRYGRTVGASMFRARYLHLQVLGLVPSP